MNLNPFRRPPRVMTQPQPPEEARYSAEQVREIVQNERARREYPEIDKTKDERYLEYLLHPAAPPNPHVTKFYTMAGEAAKHLELANIADPVMYQRLRRSVTDLFRIAAWDAPEYFEQRQLKFEAELLMTKSVGWTKNARERDALNETRNSMAIRDDRPVQPRESHGFLQGFFRG